MEQGFAGSGFERRFKWQYFNALEHSTLFIAAVDGEPAGIGGVELRRLSNGCLSGAVIDLAVAQHWRKRGVLRVLIDHIVAFARKRDTAVLTSLVNAQGAVALEHLPGWSVLAKIPLLRRDNSIEFSSQAAREGLESPDSSVGFVRSDQYREWRYRGHPLYKYRYVPVSERCGAIVKLYGTSPLGDILEVFGDVRSASELENAYRAAGADLASAGASESTTWGLLPSIELELVHRLGWRDDTQERSFAVNALSNEAQVLLNVKRWRIQPADIEHY